MAQNAHDDLPPAQVAASLAAEKRRAEITKARAEATPVHLVKIDLPFGTVLTLVFQITVAQAIIGGFVVVALLLLDVI